MREMKLWALTTTSDFSLYTIIYVSMYIQSLLLTAFW